MTADETPTLFQPPCAQCHGKGKLWNARMGNDVRCNACGGSGVQPPNPVRHAPVRHTDPATSVEAAERLTPDKLTKNQRAVLECFMRHGDMADSQLIERYNHAVPLRWKPQSDSGLRTRRKELTDGGLLEEKGRVKIKPHGAQTIWGLRQP